MTASTLQRLLSYPHPAVFEKGPADELVFRLRHPDEATWSIAEGVMTAKAGALERSYNLANTTVAGMVSALRADGFDVVHVSSRFDGYSALALVEGVGDQTVSNGDHVKAFTSLMWVLFTGYAREVSAAEYQVRQALLQMVIKTAEGEWLDLWGALYSVQRLPGETDVAYRIRIPREAFRIRVNALAIELAILELTGKDVKILEPWTEVFTLDESLLDGPHKMQDEQSIGYFFIQPMSLAAIDWSDVLPIIERNRPAGVLMLPPQVMNASIVIVPDDWMLLTSIERHHTATVWLEDLALLDFAEIEETSVPNYPVEHYRAILHTGMAEMGSTTWPPVPWLPLPWGALKYTVLTDRWRSYRVFSMTAVYEGQYWLDQEWQPLAWSDITAVIISDHSQSS